MHTQPNESSRPTLPPMTAAYLAGAMAAGAGAVPYELESRGAGVVAAPVVMVAARQVFPRPASTLAPASRPSGDGALGTSRPKRKRWAMLGGHGRNGAG